MTIWRALMIGAVIALGGAGPIAKFEERQPDHDYRSTARLEDIERCLIDMDGQIIPMVYRQPDRPDDVRLIWLRPNGIASARIDLKRGRDGTNIRAWMGAKQVANCAPRAG